MAWTKEEEQFLCSNIKRMTYPEIAQRLGKTYNMVVGKIRSLKKTGVLSHKRPNNDLYVTKHPLYGTWKRIKNQCYNPNATTFLNIEMDPEWVNSPQNFIEYWINRGWADGLSNPLF